jgi:hypothetical protein
MTAEDAEGRKKLADFAVRAKAAWARLIRKVYEADPLQCPKCKGPMRVIALIENPAVIRRMICRNPCWGAPAKRRSGRRTRPESPGSVGQGAGSRDGRIDFAIVLTRAPTLSILAPSNKEVREMAKTREIVARAMKDKAFRERLAKDAKGTIQREFGVQFPEGVTVKVHQNSSSTINLVLPEPLDVESRSLSDAELAQVAGGRLSATMDTLKCPIKW